MSLDFTSGGGGPVPVDIAVQGGRFVFVLSDGTTKESGVFPAFDSSTLDALILANRDAITAILADDTADDAKVDALASLLASVQATGIASRDRIAARSPARSSLPLALRGSSSRH